MRPVAHCRVLGPVELTIDGGVAPAELLWRKHLALLVVLARSSGRKRTRDQLMLLLWGDKPDAAARHSLNEALRILRRHLGNDAVITRGEDVRLGENAIELDANEVDRLLEQGDMNAAAELIRGEFMDGFTLPDAWDFEEWLASERRMWHQRAVATLADAATAALASGSTVRARVFAERALRLEPLSEGAVRPLMLAQALAGDRGAALSEFRRFTAALQGEYGIAPGAETEALARRISAERVWDLPAASGGREKDETRGWPLVGRARELQTLLAFWNDCRTGPRTAACVVLGDPGMGKSRLAEEVLARARLDGAITATSRAVPRDDVTPWSGLAGLDSAGAVPVTTARPGGVDPLQHVVDSRAPRDAPLAVFIDDAQWLDPESLHALRALLRVVRQRGVLLLLAVGPGPGTAPELDALVAHVGRDFDGAIVRVGPLDASALGELVHAAFPELAAAEQDRLMRRIMADSAGVPFIANALLRAITAGLNLHEIASAWPAPFRTLDQTLPAELPQAVVAAIRVDFRRLSKPAQEVLRAVALTSGPATPEPIGTAMQLEAAHLARALDELEWSRWLTSDARGYTFTARLLRTIVAEEMMTPGQRRRLAQALNLA